MTYKSFWEDGYVRKFKWTEVASRIGRLIDEGKYLSEKGMEQYTEWLKEQGYEIEPVEQRPFAVGDVVYLENDHPFMIVEIGRFDIHLNDEDFPLLGRAISKTDFLRLLRDNPKNAGLCFPDEQQQEIPFAEDNAFEPQEPFEYEKINYDAPYNAEPAKGPKGRFADNMAAIELLKKVEQRMERGGAPATPEEQTVLAKYVGWGGLSDAFDEHNEGWASEYAQLKNALTEKEYRYVTEATFDSYSWGLIENKQRFISQVYTSRSPVRSCEDVDELTLSYAELKALTAGNPKIKEKMDLEIQVSRLITLKAAFDKQYYHLQNQVTTALPAAIAEMQKNIVDCQNDIATIDANSSFNSDGKLTFRMTVQGKEYIKMEDAGKALMVLEKAAASTADGMEVGQYRGMKLVLRFQPKSQSFVVDLVGHTKRVTGVCSGVSCGRYYEETSASLSSLFVRAKDRTTVSVTYVDPEGNRTEKQLTIMVGDTADADLQRLGGAASNASVYVDRPTPSVTTGKITRTEYVGDTWLIWFNGEPAYCCNHGLNGRVNGCPTYSYSATKVLVTGLKDTLTGAVILSDKQHERVYTLHEDAAPAGYDLASNIQFKVERDEANILAVYVRSNSKDEWVYVDGKTITMVDKLKPTPTPTPTPEPNPEPTPVPTPVPTPTPVVTTVPQTGDTANLWVWVLALIFSLMGLLIISIYIHCRKKKYTALVEVVEELDDEAEQ